MSVDLPTEHDGKSFCPYCGSDVMCVDGFYICTNIDCQAAYSGYDLLVLARRGQRLEAAVRDEKVERRVISMAVQCPIDPSEAGQVIDWFRDAVLKRLEASDE